MPKELGRPGRYGPDREYAEPCGMEAQKMEVTWWSEIIVLYEGRGIWDIMRLDLVILRQIVVKGYECQGRVREMGSADACLFYPARREMIPPHEHRFRC